MKQKIKPKFNLSFLHPKYFLIWFFYFFLFFLVNICSIKILNFIGKNIGKILYFILRKRREVAKKNISICLKNLTVDEQKKLLKTNFQEVGIAIIETAMAWHLPKMRLKKLIKFKNKNIIMDMQNKNQNVILLCAHFLSLEITGVLTSIYIKGAGVYRKNNNPLLDYLILKGRSRFGSKLVEKRDIKNAIRLVKSGHCLWYAPDQNYAWKNFIFADFFEQQAATTTATSTLAKLTKAKLVPMIAYKNKDFSYSVEFLEPILGFPSKDIKQDTQKINFALEELIKKNKENYMWLHRRFKTRPNQDKSAKFY